MGLGLTGTFLTAYCMGLVCGGNWRAIVFVTCLAWASERVVFASPDGGDSTASPGMNGCEFDHSETRSHYNIVIRPQNPEHERNSCGQR